jgi:hypothetical protein
VAILGTLVSLMLPAVQSVRESSRRSQCVNRLKNMGDALANHESVRGAFPPGCDMLPRTYHAWSSFILPFLEQSAVSDRIDYTKPWDDPGGNARLADINIPTYICPSGMKMFAGKQDYGGVLGAWIDLDGNVPSVGDYEHSGILYATDKKVQRPASSRTMAMLQSCPVVRASLALLEPMYEMVQSAPRCTTSAEVHETRPSLLSPRPKVTIWDVGISLLPPVAGPAGRNCNYVTLRGGAPKGGAP